MSISANGQDVTSGHLREEQAALRAKRRLERAQAGAAKKPRVVAADAEPRPSEPSQQADAKNTEPVSEPSQTDAKNTEPASVPLESSQTDAKNTQPASVPSEPPSHKDAKNTEPAPVPSEPSQRDAKNTEPAPVPSEPSTIKAVRRKAQEEKARQGLKILQAKSDSLSDCRPRKEALLELDAATFKQLTLVSNMHIDRLSSLINNLRTT